MRKKLIASIDSEKVSERRMSQLKSSDVKEICIELAKIAHEMQEEFKRPVSIEQALYFLTSRS